MVDPSARFPFLALLLTEPQRIKVKGTSRPEVKSLLRWEELC